MLTLILDRMMNSKDRKLLKSSLFMNTNAFVCLWFISYKQLIIWYKLQNFGSVYMELGLSCNTNMILNIVKHEIKHYKHDMNHCYILKFNIWMYIFAYIRVHISWTYNEFPQLHNLNGRHTLIPKTIYNASIGTYTFLRLCRHYWLNSSYL